MQLTTEFRMFSVLRSSSSSSSRQIDARCRLCASSYTFRRRRCVSLTSERTSDIILHWADLAASVADADNHDVTIVVVVGIVITIHGRSQKDHWDGSPLATRGHPCGREHRATTSPALCLLGRLDRAGNETFQTGRPRVFPRVWNTLPEAIRRCSSPDTFKRSLKTHLYIQCYF